MIQPNELRIGNLVMTEDKELGYVHEIKQEFNDDPYDITLKDENGLFLDFMIEELKPIPITEDILLRLGFDKYKSSWRMNKTVYAKDFCEVYFGEKDIYVGFSPEVEIKYVHELQNFFFAHTKKELTTKKRKR